MLYRFLLGFPIVLVVSTASWSCGSETAHAVAGAQRARALEQRIDELGDRSRTLPVGTPEQVATHTGLHQRLRALKATFHSKKLAGLGTVTEECLRATSEELRELEALIDDYPR